MKLDKILHFKAVTSEIALEDSYGHYELVDLNVDQLKSSLMHISNKMVAQLLDALVKQHIENNNDIINEFENIKTTALKQPEDTQEMIDLISFTTKATTETIPRLVQFVNM